MTSRRFRVVCALIAGTGITPLFPQSPAALQPVATVRFHLHRDYLIVVQAMVNGAGPFDFLLDTGCSTTTVDPALDRQLKLPETGSATVALLSEVRRNRKVMLNSLRIGSIDFPAMPVLVDTLKEETALAPGIRGILGEDSLRNFDLLIDYDRRVLSFNEPAPQGERLPFDTAGTYQGRRTFNRIMIKVAFPGAGGSEAVLQLDTAAWVAELFPSSHISLSPAGRRNGLSDPMVITNAPPLYVRANLRIGVQDFRDVTFSIRRNEVASDAVGLLPTALFGSIYISHSGGFVILNPGSSRRQTRHNSLELAALGAN